MNFDKRDYSKVRETVYVYRHPSGLQAFVIPKKGYSKKYATFATHYGSINREFKVPGESTTTIVPDGIAHFLEHKLFEQKDGSVMDKFSALGSNPNAYTGFNQTVYLFSCTDRFDDNFRLLLDFVQNPYITEESVEKEKGIIGQEIRMYEDDPSWRCFFNLLRALYAQNPVRTDIAGTAESISRIDKDVLYKCYNTFYHPSNMVILVAGEVDHEEVFRQVERSVPHDGEKQAIGRIFPNEPPSPFKDHVEQNLAVSVPMFQMGFKDSGFVSEGRNCMMRETAVKMLMEMFIGRSSELYNELYAEGLINNTFDFDYSIEESYAFSILGGESEQPEKVRERVAAAVSEALSHGFDKQAFERIRRASKGRFTRQFNSVERISHAFISVYFKAINLFDYFDVYDKITLEYLDKVFSEHFRPENLAMSVIRPH